MSTKTLKSKKVAVRDTSDAPGDDGGAVVSITNNLKVSVEVFDVFNPGTTDQPEPYLYTKLGTISPGTTSSVTTFRDISQLQGMITGAISELNNLYYYRFPVKNMHGTTLAYDPLQPMTNTIGEDDRLSYIQSFKFHRFAMANPSSALTQGLTTALQAQDGDTQKTLEERVDAYFAGTKNFQNCTLTSWSVVMGWMQQYSSGWQGPYYLYEKAPDNLPGGYVPRLVATLNIQSDAQQQSAILQMCTADGSGNPVYATPAQTTNVVMDGKGKMIDESQGEDTSISLTPVWMNVIQTSTDKSGNAAANYLIGSAVCGSVNGTDVVSSQTARQIPGKPEKSDGASSFDQVFGKLCGAVGLIAGLIMVYEFVTKKWAERAANKEAARKTAKDSDDLNDQNKGEDKGLTDDISRNCAVPENKATLESAPEVETAYKSMSTTMRKEVVRESIENEEKKIDDEINEQLDDGATPTPEFENAFKSMKKSFSDANSDLDSDDIDGAVAKVNEAQTGMQTALDTQGKKMDQWEKDALKDSSDTLKEVSEESGALDDAETQYEDDMDNDTDDSGYDGDSDEAPDTDPIVGGE